MNFSKLSLEKKYRDVSHITNTNKYTELKKKDQFVKCGKNWDGSKRKIK